MTENLERRHFIKSVGLVTAAAAASTLGQHAAEAQPAKQSGAKLMA